MTKIISFELALLIEEIRLKFPFLYSKKCEYAVFDKSLGMICQLYSIKDIVDELKEKYGYDLITIGNGAGHYKWHLIKNDSNKVSDFQFYCSEKCAQEEAIKYFINHILPHINNKND